MEQPTARTHTPFEPPMNPQGPKGTHHLPVISRFYGIVVYMNYRDHEPPHFHARYKGQDVLIEIEPGLIKGSFSEASLATVG